MTVLRGPVVRGAGRGHGLGFPTANLGITAGLPADGVYFAWFRLDGDGQRRAALLSVGSNPTFGPGGRTAEAYVLDTDENMYGRSAEVEIVTMLREQTVFATADELTAAMAADEKLARRLMATSSRTGPGVAR